jgi:tetratricopeptide (TPR) repeat protein
VPLDQPEFFNEQVLNFLNGAEFFQVLNKQGVMEAVEMFNKKHNEDNSWIPFSEARMNALGYQKLQAGEVAEAIELFKLNVMAYPESANTYDSLGEAYMKTGDNENAIIHYRKSLELNSENDNAKKMLRELEKTQIE